MRPRALVAAMLGLVVFVACKPATTPSSGPPPPAPTRDSCGPSHVASADVAEVVACAERRAATDPTTLVEWAHAAIAQRTPPAIALLRGLARFLDSRHYRPAFIELRRDLVAHLTRVGEFDAAITQYLGIGPDDLDRVTRTFAATAHLGAAALAAERDDPEGRCMNLVDALVVDISLKEPLRAYFAASCPTRGGRSAIDLCRYLASIDHVEQSRTCLQHAVARPDAPPALDDLILDVYARLGPSGLPELRALARQRPSLRARLSRLDRCNASWKEDGREVESMGVYLALSRDDTLEYTDARCYAKLAASLCFTAARENRECPMPEALVTFVRDEIDTYGLHGFIDALRPIKAAKYRELRVGGCGASNTVTLFYFHFAISELLLRDKIKFDIPSKISDPEFQVCSMRAMYRSAFGREMSAGDQPRGAEQYACDDFEPPCD